MNLLTNLRFIHFFFHKINDETNEAATFHWDVAKVFKCLKQIHYHIKGNTYLNTYSLLILYAFDLHDSDNFSGFKSVFLQVFLIRLRGKERFTLFQLHLCVHGSIIPLQWAARSISRDRKFVHFPQNEKVVKPADIPNIT